MIEGVQGFTPMRFRRIELVDLMMEMLSLMLAGGPESMPKREEIECYADRFIEERLKKQVK